MPSSNPSSKENETFPVPTSLRDSLSCLNVIWSDMSETEDLNPDAARQHQADFLKGTPPKWHHFYTSVNLPLVERDGFNDLIHLVEKRKGKRYLITDISFRYQPGSGGSTLAMQVLWRLRKDLRCARVIDSKLDTKELSKQVVDLFLLSSEEHAKQNRRTVLLLLDTKEKTDNDLPIKNILCGNLTEEIHKRGINTDTPIVIILNCIPTDFTLTDTMVLPPKLSEREIRQFKEKVLQQIRLQRKGHWKVTTINLFHQKDSGGPALTEEILRDLREEFRCETWTEPFKTDITENKEFAREIEKMTNALLSIYETHQNTVLLLLDHTDDKPLRYLIKNLQSKLQRADQTDHPAFIIINAVSKSTVRAKDDVKLKMELLPQEQERFAQKRLELKKKFKKMSLNLHAFNIMHGGFKKEDAEAVITDEMKKHVDKNQKSSSTRLLSFLALINSYVPGSHLSKLLCKEFIKQEEWSTDEGKPSVEMIMKPFEDLIVTYSEGEQKGNCIRLAHPMIADACLKMFNESKLTRFDIALDFLNSLVKGKQSSYVQICKSMLVTRLEGLIKKEKFSKLIIDILDERENNTNLCIRLLKLASNLFSTDPFYPQALARLYYIEVKEQNKYEKATKQATEAIRRDPEKSHIRDTLGQVLKHHLRNQSKKPFSDIKVCLAIAQSAADAFKEEEKAAQVESEDNTKFNNRGYFGFLQVCNIIHDLGPKKPLEQEYSNLISGLRGDVESRYDFFEWYLAFSRPSISKEEPDYFCKDVEDCYMHYFKQGEQTNEMTLNEKKMKSFGGLLHFLKSDINVLKENQSALKNPQSEHEVVLYILANIILSQSGEPCEEAEDLQARLQELWATETEDRRPEFYLLVLLLFWPDEAQPAIANPPDLEKCVQLMSQSYERKYQKYLHGRYLVPLFFFGKGKGLQRLLHTSKLHQADLELLTEGDEKAETKCLQRINGNVENHKVFAVIEGQQIPVTPHNQVSVYKQGLVSFYLGFNIRGPIAYNIRHEEN
ncbi:sterile alpha motif domain-containing protein 9-like [Onychostoma macrolepis]|uniref:sterile alpha motif domain-containing protein 9-like n=1 Tax=Onychostoma macrolepis TaxID=369639 RepID=UPI00272ADC2D|nr:sterile alpha motif domain-containing protein 9-like [Onychostoma macrolepis]